MSQAFPQLQVDTEAAVLAGIRQGGTGRAAAFDALFRALRQPVLALCLHLTGRRSEEVRRVQAAFATLPAEHRVVLALFALDGLGHAAIAGILGVPEGTVWSRLHAARARLREILGRQAAP